MLQELVQQIENTAKDVVNGIHTALPGKILSFDWESGTAAIKLEGTCIMADGSSLEYPVVTDVPVVFPYSPSIQAGMVFPVMEGDSCLVIISEVGLEQWRDGTKPEGVLRYDLTNAVAIPGLMRAGGTLLAQACMEEAVVVKSGNTKLALSPSGVVLHGDLIVEGSITSIGAIQDEAVKQALKEASGDGYSA